MDTDFPAADLTPEYLTYDYDHDLDPDHGNLKMMPEIRDNYLSVEVSIPRGGSMVKRCVKSCKRDADGNPISRADANPILDTREYIVEFEDGNEAELNANLIAEAMYVQCDPNGNQYVLLDSLVDHRCLDMAIQPADQKVVRPDGRTYMKRNTIGWKICC
jgi:hypothetical protein